MVLSSVLYNPSALAGKLLTLFWSIFAMNLVFFYNSNLRANIIASEREKYLDTHEDIVAFDKPVYIPWSVKRLR